MKNIEINSKNIKLLMYFVGAIIYLPLCAFAAGENYVCTGTNVITPSYPSFPNVQFDMIGNQSLVIDPSATMQVVPAAGAVNHTVSVTGVIGSGSLGYFSLTIQPNATLSYSGTNSSATTLYCNLDDNNGGSYTYDITNKGTIDKGTGTNAIQLQNTAAPAQGIIANTGSIIGNVILDTVMILNHDGTGVINGNITSGLQLNLGNTSAVTFTTQGTITNTQNITLYNGSLTVNNAISGVTGAMTLNSGTTTFINSTVTGTGSFSNAGSLNIGAVFTPSGFTGGFTNTSGVYLIGSGSISGAMSTGTFLRIGQDSTGAANSCNFTTSGAISNIPIIRVYNGSLIANNAISGVNTSFTVDASTSATLNAAVSGSGSVTNNGTITVASVNGLNTSGSLSNPGTITMTSSWTPNIGVNVFTNSGILNVNGGTFTKPTNFTYSGIVNINGSGVFSGALTGTGSAAQLNIGPVTSNTFTTSSAVSSIPAIHVYNSSSFTANHAVSGVDTSFIVESLASATFNAAISGAGSITNNGTMTLGASSSLTSFSGLSNNLTLSVTGATTNNIAITNNSGMTIAANVAGSGTITNQGNATLTLSSGAVSNAITNSGTFQVTGASSIPSLNNSGTTTITGALTNSGSISNSGTMSIAANVLGAGTISNTSNGTLTLTSGTVSNAISNTGRFDVNGVSGTTSVNNSGTMNINANLTNSGSFTSTNILTIAANLSMAGQSFTGSGTTTISGQRTVTAASYSHIGTQYFTLSSPSVYDSLTCTGCAVNLSGGTVDITLGYTLNPNQTVNYTILTGASLTAPSTIVKHTQSALDVMTVTTNATSILVSIARNVTFATLAYPGINLQIANVLDLMAAGSMNAQQTTLINAISANTTATSLNAALHSLIPNFNSADANIVFQNDSFKKIEQRVAALRDGNGYLSKDTYVAGDLDSCRAMWLSAFGGSTKQLSLSENDGYKARSAGMLIGFDNRVGSDHLFGIAVGMSGSTIDEYSNTGFYTDVLRYHALIYGSHNPVGSSFFDWVLSGSSNNNRGIRPIFSGGTDLSTSSNYNSTLFSGKMTFSTSFDCGCTSRFTPLTSVQFTNINQPAYDESGGVAALHVDSQEESIFTIGVGGRINFPINEWPSMPMQELRFLVSYDAIAGSNDTTANFVAGSTSFTVSNPPSRLALSLGAGLTYEFNDDLQFQANYDLQLRKRFIDQVGMLKIRYFL